LPIVFEWLLGVVASLVLVAPLAFAWFVSGFVVHRPPESPAGEIPGLADGSSPDPRSLFGLDFANVVFRTSDDIDVSGWLVPASGDWDSRSAVIFVHGRGGTRHFVLGILQALNAAGLAVLSIDARGHGETLERTAGAAFVTGSRDVTAALTFLRDEHGFGRIGLFGASQGAGSVLMAAAQAADVDVVVSQSGGTSLFGLLRGMTILGWVPDWEISLICSVSLYRMGAPWETVLSPKSGPIDAVGDVAPTPLLIVHGDADELVSLAEAHRLYERAHEPKELWIIAGRGHEDLAQDPDYTHRIVSFLSEHLRGTPRLAAE
jgi:alpha-beta hydrolase superfamily lysophospholipase